MTETVTCPWCQRPQADRRACRDHLIGYHKLARVKAIVEAQMIPDARPPEPAPRPRRKCGLCHLPGHTRRTCSKTTTAAA